MGGTSMFDVIAAIGMDGISIPASLSKRLTELEKKVAILEKEVRRSKRGKR